MHVQPFYDPRTNTVTYVVAEGGDAVVIDPVWDFDPASGRVWREAVGRVLAWVAERSLRVHAILETHAHADHLSGAQVLKAAWGAPVMIGERITAVQATFGPIFDLGPEFVPDGRQFDRLLRDGEVLAAGAMTVRVLATPGHTPACMSYVIGNAVFTGDALFLPDSGVGRCDFPAGSAVDLYRSVHERLYALPDDTRLFVGHDYQPAGRAPAWESTIGESKRRNVHLCAETTEAEFAEFRRARDATLGAPKLLLPSLQVNIRAGALPPAHDNGRRYLLLPLKEG